MAGKSHQKKIEFSKEPKTFAAQKEREKNRERDERNGKLNRAIK